MSLEDTFENWHRAKRSAALLAPVPSVTPRTLAETSSQTPQNSVAHSAAQTSTSLLSDASSQTSSKRALDSSSQTEVPWISAAQRDALAKTAADATALEILISEKDAEVQRLRSLLKAERREARAARAEAERLREALRGKMGTGQTYTDAALDVELCIEDVERLCGKTVQAEALAEALASERERSEALQQRLLEVQTEKAELSARVAQAEAEAVEKRAAQSEAFISMESLRESRGELETLRLELKRAQELLAKERKLREDGQREAEAIHVQALTAAAERESALERSADLDAEYRALEEAQRVMEAKHEDEVRSLQERLARFEADEQEATQQVQAFANMVVLELAPLHFSLEPSNELSIRDMCSRLERSNGAMGISLLRDAVAGTLRSLVQRVRKSHSAIEHAKGMLHKESTLAGGTDFMRIYLRPSEDKLDLLEERIHRLQAVVERLSKSVRLKNRAVDDARQGCLLAERVIETLHSEKTEMEMHLQESVRSRLVLAMQVQSLEAELHAEKLQIHTSLAAARDAVSAAHRIQKRFEVEANAREGSIDKEVARC
eukprot:scaffold1883_cov261-Pinguiococcus_pyrenoidosus.AAC.4